MQKRVFLLTGLLAAFITANVVNTQGQEARAQLAVAIAQKPPTTNPIATFHDYDASGTVLMLLRSDDYNGTNQATYAPSSSRSSIISTWVTGGEWNLNLAQQSLRTLYITPNVPINNLQPEGPPAGNYSEGVTARCGCFDQNANLVPLANVVTSSGNCKLGVNFIYSGTSYKLLMSPFPLSGSGDPPPTCPPGGCPATGLVTVTCNALGSDGRCVDWTIEPNVDGPNAGIANLYRLSSAKGSSTLIFIGQYYNSFRISLINQ